MQESGTAGTKITVWGQERSPRREYVDYYTDLLNKIGYDASEKIIADEVYFPTIGNAKTDPQTGFADWIQDFPNPSDFYLLMDGAGDPADEQPELQQGQRPEIQSALKRLNPVPATSSTASPTSGRRSTSTLARQAYVVVYGAESDAEVLLRPDRLRRPPCSTRRTSTTGRPCS